MIKKYKNIFLSILVIFILLEMVNTLISPDMPFFIYPSGSDQEIGEAIGYDTWRIIELAIVFYVFIRYVKNRSVKNVIKQTLRVNK